MRSWSTRSSPPKRTSPSSRDLGDGGVGVRGSHLLQTPHRRVAADSVVIWTDDGLTWRLEGTAELDELIEIAGQLDRVA